MTRKSFVLMVMGTVVFFLCSVSSADVPGMINYMGKLTKPNGGLLNGTFQMTFSIYPDTLGSPAHWTETQAEVEVKHGVFSVLLGTVNPIPASVFDGSIKYLGIQVESDPEMRPLKPMVSVTYAFHSATADTAFNVPPAGVLSIDGVSNPGGDVDLIPDDAISITPDDGANTITVGETHSGRTDNPHQVTSAQTGALVSVDGVDNPGGNVDFVAGSNMTITPNPGANNVTFSATGAAGGWVDGGAVVRLETGTDSVGIGTTSPTDKLHVIGNIKASGTIQSGSSITIDGATDKITASSGTIDFDDEVIVTAGKAILGPGSGSSWPNCFVAGENNSAISIGGTIGGGIGNTAGQHPQDSTVTVSGGQGNVGRGDYSTVGGGHSNSASSNYHYGGATCSGGRFNSASGEYSTVAGGFADTAYHYSAVGGGVHNWAGGSYATISGGYNNRTGQNKATIGGGSDNYVSDHWGTIGGGQADTVTAASATIGGGYHNIATGKWATIGGGINNYTYGRRTTVAGGGGNAATAENAAVGGGSADTASGQSATVAGGQYNVASGTNSTISGGDHNNTSSLNGAVGGGGFNTVSGNVATIAGGGYNTASGVYSGVGGGYNNVASGGSATIAGGYSNVASGGGAAIAGGSSNEASAQNATIGGGYDNVAGGDYAMVPGGYYNAADGNYSFAAGTRAKANHRGAFVWADYTTADFASTALNEFNVRASGGVRIFTNVYLTAGVTLSPGASSWSSVSDSSLKRNIRPADGEEILQKVAQLPISRWSYKAQDASIEHVGPMAQDFYALFGLGDDNKTITTLDLAGIALAAIKVLEKNSQKQKTEIEQLKTQVSELQEIVKILLAQRENEQTGENTQLGMRR